MPSATVANPDVAGDMLHNHVRRVISRLPVRNRVKWLARLAGVSSRTAEDWLYRNRRPSAGAALVILSSDPAALAAFQADMTVFAQSRQAADRARKRLHDLETSSRDLGVAHGADAEPQCDPG
jgi:hypothetical protein